MSHLPTLRRRFDEIVAQLPKTRHPPHFRTSSTAFADPFVEEFAGTLHYVVHERGIERTRRTTTDPDELLCWLIRDVVWNIAVEWELANRIPNRDGRRLIFAKQLELLTAINPTWAARRQAEITTILQSHPYNDDHP